MQANSIPVELLNQPIDALHLRRVHGRMQQLPLLLNSVVDVYARLAHDIALFRRKADTGYSFQRA
jgi:hypothetical protein